MESRAGVRSPGFRFLAILALVLGFIVGEIPGPGVALSAWAVSEAAWRYLGLIVIVWMSLAAVQDTTARTDVLVYSKPQPTERLVLARFLAAYWQLLLVLVAMYIGGVAGRLYIAGGLTGSPVYISRYAVSAGVLFFTAAASYSMALLARTPLAGAVVGLYWILTLAGKSYLAKAYFPAYTQNLPTYLLLGVFLICFACCFYRRQRRGRAPVALWAVLTPPAALGLSIVALRYTIQTGHDPMTRMEPALELMSSQNATLGLPTPGFRLPDESGHLVSLADYPGRVFVIALFSPADSESANILDRLEEMNKKYGARGVQPIAICLSEDLGAARLFARGEDVHYPILADWGTHNAEKVSDMSPMATAFQASTLPHVVVTDRRRNIRAVLAGLEQEGGLPLDDAIQKRLAQEPE